MNKIENADGTHVQLHLDRQDGGGALCRLATGGGFAVRQLYTDQDEVPSTPLGRSTCTASRASWNGRDLPTAPAPPRLNRSARSRCSEANSGLLLKPSARAFSARCRRGEEGLKKLHETRLQSATHGRFRAVATACETGMGGGTFWWPIGKIAMRRWRG